MQSYWALSECNGAQEKREFRGLVNRDHSSTRYCPQFVNLLIMKSYLAHLNPSSLSVARPNFYAPNVSLSVCDELIYVAHLQVY